MATRNMKQGLVSAALGLAACANGDQVLLGHQQLQADAAAEACTSDLCSDTGADPNPPTPDVPAPTPCNQGASERLPIALYRRTEPMSSCGDTPCHLDLQQVHPAADGSVWVTGPLFSSAWSDMDPPSPHAWIGHFAADGTALGELIVEGTDHPYLALDDRAQTWLLDGRTLQRLDAAAQRLGDPIPAPDGRGLDALPNQGVLLLTTSGVSCLGYAGQLLWAQSIEDTQPSGLALGPTGFAVWSPIERMAARATIGISAYGTGKKALWSSASSTNFGGPAGARGLDFFAFDAQANLVLATIPPVASYSTRLNYGALDIESIDREGQSRWTFRSASSFGLYAGIALGPTGEVWVAEFEGERPRVPGLAGREIVVGGTLAVIAQDGSSCRRYGYDGGVIMINGLAFSPTGELWFADDEAFGRFTLPTQ